MPSTAVDAEAGARRPGVKEAKPGADAAGSSDFSIRSFPGDQTHRTLRSRHIQLIGTYPIGDGGSRVESPESPGSADLCGRYWRDHWHRAVRPDRKGVDGWRTRQFVYCFLFMVSQHVRYMKTWNHPSDLSKLYLLTTLCRCTFILAVTLGMAEMVTYLPISSPFIRFAGRYVDEAFGFAAGWNFFVFEAAMVPFEITACNVIIHYWSEAVPAGGIIAIIIVLYAYVLSISFLRQRSSRVGISLTSQTHQPPCRQVVRRSRVLGRPRQSHLDRRPPPVHLHRHARGQSPA